MSRLDDLIRFYDLLEQLRLRLGGFRRLAECAARTGWPDRGIYFFFEAGEVRLDSGIGPRVVRVGTHALAARSRTTLWQRLSNHRGPRAGVGNHRGSIFRLLVGTALRARDREDEPRSWGIGSSAGEAATRLGLARDTVIAAEAALEQKVSAHIGTMNLLWLKIDDPPGPDSLRGYIERHSIGLLSAFSGDASDPPSENWLGRWCDRERVRRAGLWNQNHVDDGYDPAFLQHLERLVAE
ncbi:MAG: hypothetical protein AB7G08_32815 [Hyphomicrobiaceae bacterium]